MAFNTARTVSRLDRRVKGDAITSGYASTTLTFTLPYKIATDGSEGTLVVARISTGLVQASTRPANNQVAIAGVTNVPSDYYIGVLFTFRYRLATLLKHSISRAGESVIDLRGRLIVRYIRLKLHDTTDVAITVLLKGRSMLTYTYRNVSPDLPDTFRVPVLGRNTTATIEFVDTSPGICYVDGLDWEGTHATTTTRV